MLKQMFYILSFKDMSSKKYLQITIFIINYFFMQYGVAQYDETVTVIGDYEPTISDAYKININPKITDTAIIKPKLNYVIQPKLIYTDFAIEPIMPAKIVGEKLPKLYKNFAKIGFGNYTTPYIEFHANSLRSKDYSIGVGLLHHSSSGKIKDFAHPGFSHNEFNIYGKKFYRKHLLAGGFNYTRDVNHYYGYKPDAFYPIEFSKDDIKQRYNLLETRLNFNSTYPDSNHLNHTVSLKHSFLSNRFDSWEHNVRFDAGINKAMELFDFTDKQTLGIATTLDFYSNQDSLVNNTSYIFEIEPFISTSFNEYELIAGIRGSLQGDSSSDFKVFPVAEAKIFIIRDVLMVFGGITGGAYRSGLKSLSEKNPFIVSRVPMNMTTEEFKFYGGISSSLSKDIDFTASLSTSTFSNMPFYVTDTFNLFLNDFTVVYDDVNFVNLAGELIFHKDKKWHMALKGNFYQYIMSDEKEAWHKPAYDIWITTAYNIQDKINIRCSIFAVGKSFVKRYDINNKVISKSLDAYADLNLELEYRYTPILSGFIKLNNITANRYYRWYRYPSQQFNFLAGITYSF